MVGITFNVVITGDTNFTLIGINGFHIAFVDGGFVGARCQITQAAMNGVKGVKTTRQKSWHWVVCIATCGTL